MKNTFANLILMFSSILTYAQPTYVTGAVFKYDLAGNREYRKMDIVCIGCPKPTSKDSIINNATIDSDNTLYEAYPNPTNSDVIINNRSWKEKDKADVIVYDVQGKSIFKKTLFQAKDIIPFSALAPGVYILQYYINEQPGHVWRIIKM